MLIYISLADLASTTQITEVSPEKVNRTARSEFVPPVQQIELVQQIETVQQTDLDANNFVISNSLSEDASLSENHESDEIISNKTVGSLGMFHIIQL